VGYSFLRGCGPPWLITVVDRILQEQRRLEAEEESATSDLHRIQKEFNEQFSKQLAKLSRVQKQKQYLIKKGKEIVRRNISNLDKLEEVEYRESEVIVPASGAFDGIDWSIVDFSSLGPEPAGLGSSGGTVVQAVDNVSNS
jgi:hypothetical protein